jgi:pimeloyl-ACP methyl ester carboxylesterase
MSQSERHAHADAERPEWDQDDRRQYLDIKTQFNLAVLEATQGGTRAAPAWRDTVAGITCPILLIRSDVDRGGIVSAAVGEEATRIGRDLRVAHVPNAGHNVRRDNYPPYRDAVTSFLREVLR